MAPVSRFSVLLLLLTTKVGLVYGQAKPKVTQFNLHNHLTTPTRRDLRDGVENSHRLRRNLQFLPEEAREKQRKLLADASLYDYDDKGFFTAYRDPSVTVIENPSRVDLLDTVLPLPFMDGPGVQPAFPEGTREFWEAQEGAKPTKLWEVIACPVVDPSAYLQNPLRCYFGDGTGSLWNFLEGAFTGDQILNVIKDLIAPLAAEIIVSLLVPTHLFQPLIDIICTIWNLVKTLTDALNPFSWFSRRRNLEETGERNLQAGSEPMRCDGSHWGAESCMYGADSDAINACDQCFQTLSNGADCNDCMYCYRPFSTTKQDMKGVCLNIDAAISIAPHGDQAMPLPARSFLYNLLQANYVEEKNDAMIEEIRLAVFGDSNQQGSSTSNVEAMVNAVDQCSTCATKEQVEAACTPENRFLQAMHPEESETTTFRSEYLRSRSTKDKKIDHSSSDVKEDSSNTRSDGRSEARKLGLSEEQVDDIISNFGSILKGSATKGASESVHDKILSVVSNPQVLEQLQEHLDGKAEGEDSPVIGIASHLLQQTIDKETGTFDMVKFDAVHSELKKMQSGNFESFTSTPSSPSFPSKPSESKTRELQFDDCDPDAGCDDTCPIQYAICTFKGFIKCTVELIIKEVFETVGAGFSTAKEFLDDAGLDIGPAMGMVFSFVKELDPWSGGSIDKTLSDYPLYTLMEAIIDVFQGIVAVLVFGCEGDITSEEFKTCLNKLPSKDQKIVSMSENEEGRIFLTSGCPSEFGAELAWYKPVLTILQKLVKDIGQSIIEPVNTPLSLVEFILEAAGILFGNLGDACSYLDGSVSGAKASALYENSRYILQEVACREVPNLLPGHGCDGVDNNCNFQRDDCSEDIYDPTIDFSRVAEFCGANKILFKSAQEAEDCVKQHVIVEDDCQDVTFLTAKEQVDPLSICDDTWQITVGASTHTCAQMSTKDFSVSVNENIETETCEFTKGNNAAPELDISQAIALCDEQIFPTLEEAEACVLRNSKALDAAGGCRPVEITVASTVDNCEVSIMVTATVCEGLSTTEGPINVIVDGQPPVTKCSFGVGATMDETGPGVLTDALLSYSATDNCGGVLDVTIESFSNEYEDVRSQEMIRHYQVFEEPNVKIGVFVSAAICSTASNGQCIQDKNALDQRFYVTRVTAKDSAGLVGNTTCYFEVVDNNENKGGAPIENSTQRFLIDTYHSSAYVADAS